MEAEGRFRAILRVNKQIHDEAAPIFYSSNRFAVGIGNYGSSRSSNLHGLKAFIARVPPGYISPIKRVVLVIHLVPLSTHIATFSNTSPTQVFASEGDASDVHKIGRILLKRFTGLQSVSVYWMHKSRGLFEPMLSASKTNNALVKIIRILMQHTTLRQIHCRNLWNLEALENVFEIVSKQEKEASGRSITVEQVPFAKQKSSWTLSYPETEYHLRW